VTLDQLMPRFIVLLVVYFSENIQKHEAQQTQSFTCQSFVKFYVTHSLTCTRACCYHIW